MIRNQTKLHVCEKRCVCVGPFTARWSFQLLQVLAALLWMGFIASVCQSLLRTDKRKSDSMSLYPLTQPNDSGFLQVSDIHSIYWEECGRKDGLPLIYVHGGPGGGIDPSDRRYFDPSVYRVVLFDQRGAGKSTPSASLEENTTWHLVEDMERLREKLNIEKWVVFGGSWGSTLSLAYSETHPDRCLGLILRGIFTLRRKELLWFYQEGANFLFADFYEEYRNQIPPAEQDDLMTAYYKRLTGDDEDAKLACAAAWSKWETATSRLIVDPEYIKKSTNPKWALAFARIESHYFVNGGWMEDGQLLKNVDKIKHLPIAIVQGRYDIVCPAITSYELYKALGGEQNDKLTYKVLGDCGHSAHEKAIEEELVRITDAFKVMEF